MPQDTASEIPDSIVVTVGDAHGPRPVTFIVVTDRGLSRKFVDYGIPETKALLNEIENVVNYFDREPESEAGPNAHLEGESHGSEEA